MLFPLSRARVRASALSQRERALQKGSMVILIRRLISCISLARRERALYICWYKARTSETYAGIVIPANAGIQILPIPISVDSRPRFRGDDNLTGNDNHCT